MKTSASVAKKVIAAYVPVLHQGYRTLLENNPSFHSLYILDDDILDAFRSIQKDLRRLKPQLVRQSLTSWNLLDEIVVANEAILRKLNKSDVTVLMPDEDISHELAEKLFPLASVEYAPIFLRWDRRSSNAEDPVYADEEVAEDDLARTFFDAAENESQKSSDIWRRVGAVLARDGKLLLKTHNQATPTPHSSWMYGDPRNNFKKGVTTDKTVFIHAEAKLIGKMARIGEVVDGTDLYVTTFPCPTCAMLIAESGIKRVFFQSGYATLDGLNVLKEAGVKIIRVLRADAPVKDKTSVPYPEK